MIKYTLTYDSVVVLADTGPVTVQRGAPNFDALRQALLAEDWGAASQHLTVNDSLLRWAQGHFTLVEGVFYYKGEALPTELNERICQMASCGDNPTPFFNFWERLQKNPSHRSVNQLWPFLLHAGIPLTPDGCFLAYKSVRLDYRDHHTGTYLNVVGAVIKEPRNKISDDPDVPCHFGLHVGSKEYAENFGPPDSRIMAGKVDPMNVVCIPRDSSYMKMRVCEYAVAAELDRAEWMPSTVAYNEPSERFEEEEDEGGEGDWEEDAYEEDEELDPAVLEEAVETVRSWERFDDLDEAELSTHTLADLRRYAVNHLKMKGAGRLPGGKPALVAAILAYRP